MIFIDELETDITQLSAMLYNLNEEESTNEKFIEESFPGGVSEEGLYGESNEELLR